MAHVRGWAFALSLAGAVALTGLIGLMSTTLPVFSSTPTTDAWFGKANACLIEALGGDTRLGFAVSADGERIAAFSAAAVASCTREGEQLARLEQLGIRALAFDGTGQLWLSEDGSLLRGGSALHRVGELSVEALAGTAHGAVVIDSGLRLLSLDASGAPTAVKPFEPPPERLQQLLSSTDGRHVAVIADRRLLVVDAVALAPIRFDVPCDVARASWDDERTLTVLCGPGESWALKVDVLTGAREAIPLPKNLPVATLPAAKRSIRGCEGLPCSAALE